MICSRRDHGVGGNKRRCGKKAWQQWCLAQHNYSMQIPFTKMQGAGNDFIVLDETKQRYGLTFSHFRALADRHYGIGADQILIVRPSPAQGIDFEYIIHNADGSEVEQCGNGARCFARFVREKGLSDKKTIRVQTRGGVIEPQIKADGCVTVDMGSPAFHPSKLPFDTTGLVPSPSDLAYTNVVAQKWPLALDDDSPAATVFVALVSMGNPHAVVHVDNVYTAPVNAWGPLIEGHPRFAQHVNAGFMHIVDTTHICLRVYERGAGETLACGTGACAAVVSGIRQGLLLNEVQVDMRGGRLTIAWSGRETDPVYMTGPADTVFDGVVTLPETL